MADFVTVAELRETLGIGALYSDANLEEVCTASTDVINAYLWKNSAGINAVSLSNNVATIWTINPQQYQIGQTVTITNAGTTFNGVKTITGVRTHSFTFDKTASNVLYTILRPYGTVTGPIYITYNTTQAIREAALSLAASIWQARQTSSGGSVAVDFTPSPWQLGSSLISKVKGLLAPYMAPEAIIG